MLEKKIMKKLYWNLKAMIDIYFLYEIYKIYPPYTIRGIKGSLKLLQMYLNKENIG